MRHIPHLLAVIESESEHAGLSPTQWRHLSKVLRLGAGETVTYTDGRGRLGRGSLAERSVLRGEEWEVPRPTDLIMAVAPPANRHRQRFLVEKLAELGVARLRWLRTKHGTGRVAAEQKLQAWVASAVEQSGGAWLMEATPDLVELGDLDRPLVACNPGGGRETPPARTVAIGPEGGFAPGELPDDVETWDLGPTMLRVETAAVVAAARVLA